MAKSPDRLEREAQLKSPQKYNAKKPIPGIDLPAPSVLDQQPTQILPTEEETKFANLPVEEYGNVKAIEEGWQAAEELAQALGVQASRKDKTGLYYPGYDPIQDEIVTNVAREKLAKANATVASYKERLQRPLSAYPSLLRAVASTPNLNEADVRRVVNFAAAWTAADAYFSLGDDEYSKNNILLSLPDVQRVVVLDIIQAKIDEEAKSIQDEEEAAIAERKTWGAPREIIQGQILPAIGENVAKTFEALETGYENIQRAARAQQLGQNIRKRRGEMGFSSLVIGAIQDPFFLWDEVGPNTWDPETDKQLRAEYGTDIVDIVKEIKILADEGDPYPISTVQAKYYGDPEKARILRLLTQRQFADEELVREQEQVLSAADKILSSQASDLGKMITTTNTLTGEPVPVDSWWRGSIPQQALAATANVASTFLLDPLIVGNKVRNIYVAARYGLERIAVDAGEETVEKALRSPAVTQYIDDLTKDLKEYSAMKAEGKDTSRLGQQISRRYANYFPEDVIFQMADEGIDSTEKFIKYVQDSNAALKIERGQVIDAPLTAEQKAQKIASIESKSMFQRLAGQQIAKRGKPLLPRNSVFWGTYVRRQISRAIGKMPDSKQAREEIRAFYRDANNPNLPAGAILFDDPSAVAKFDEKITTGWDRVTRWAAQTTGRSVIYTADARDTQVFYRYARLFMSKKHAQYLADEWRNADQGRRILMWVGIVRSTAERVGSKEIADETRHLGTRLINNKTNVTVGEITDTLTFASDPRNLFAPESFVLDDAGRTVDDWIDDQVKEFVDQRALSGLDTPDDMIDSFRAGLMFNNPDAENVLSRAIRTSPSNFNGQQLALHLWQTSDYLSVPNLSDLELITKRSKLTNAVLGARPDSFVNNFVNWWSLINLAGFRYSMRNATEDYTMYALTGGYLMDVVKGRAISTAMRESRGLEVESATFGRQPNIGFFARKMRKARGEAGPEYDPYSFWDNIVLPVLNKEEVALANEARANGDLAKFRELIGIAVVRQKLGKTLSEDELRYATEYVMSDANFLILDDVVELAQYLNLGTMPGAKFSGAGVSTPGSTMMWPRSSFKNIEMTGNSPMKYVYWHRNLENTILRDGPIGKVAVANLDDPKEAVRQVVNALESNPKYRERLAAFYEMKVSDQEFAERYVQDVLNNFSRRDGSLNTELWSKFVSRDADGNRVVSWNAKIDGEYQPILTLQDLSKFDPSQAPKYVLGKGGGDEAIEIPASVSERIWDAMGNAFARIAKEPIYFANYLRARKGLAQYEQKLADAMGPQAASIAASKVAQDRALNVTLAFTDNPENRSVLAWRLRNYARYYRAQEDFYRRVYRAAKFDPISVYKAYLTIGVLDDTGFIYEDSFGEKYFLYPGDQLINSIIARAMGYSPDGTMSSFLSAKPLLFGGKVKFLAPSFDPGAALPMLSSPVSTVLVKLGTNFVPSFKKYEEKLLGEYSVGKPIPEAIIPGPLGRFMATLSQDERNSMFTSASISAMRVLEAAGMMPGEDATAEERATAQNSIAAIASQIVPLRFALGLVFPAVPQVMDNDVTTFARQFGVDGLTNVYRNLVNKAIERGDADPYSSALVEGVSIYGTDFVAYEVSETNTGIGLKSLPEYVYDTRLLDFVEKNKELVKDYPEASYFLGPIRDPGMEYDPNVRRFLIENGYKQPKSIQEFSEHIRQAEGEYVYQVTMDDADAAIAAGTATEEDKEAAKTKVYAKYPDLSLGFAKSSMEKQRNADYMLNGATDEDGNRVGRSEIRGMVEDFYAGKYGDKVPFSVEKIAEAIATYDYFTLASKEIYGQKTAEKQARKQNRVNLLANLRSIAEEDPNAEMFIRRVMYPLLDADYRGRPR